MKKKTEPKKPELTPDDTPPGDSPGPQVETLPPPPPAETIGGGGLDAPALELAEETPDPEQMAEQRKHDEHLAKVAAGMFVMANDVMVGRLFPGDPMRVEEKKQLQEATEELVSFYGDGVMPPWLAVWIQFSVAMGLIYGVRYASEQEKQAARKPARPQPPTCPGGGRDREDNHADIHGQGDGPEIPGSPGLHP